MTDRKPRKTLQQMATGDEPPVEIAGKPADQCPYCGAGMFANRTDTLDTRIVRYVVCRNPKCGKRFVSKQPTPPPAVLVREIGADDDSSGMRMMKVG